MEKYILPTRGLIHQQVAHLWFQNGHFTHISLLLKTKQNKNQSTKLQGK